MCKVCVGLTMGFMDVACSLLIYVFTLLFILHVVYFIVLVNCLLLNVYLCSSYFVVECCDVVLCLSRSNNNNILTMFLQFTDYYSMFLRRLYTSQLLYLFSRSISFIFILIFTY